jgi:hypothetical protein
MTAEAHAARIQATLGSNPPRNKRLPIDLFIPFFEDLWKSGVFPSGPVLQQASSGEFVGGLTGFNQAVDAGTGKASGRWNQTNAVVPLNQRHE